MLPLLIALAQTRTAPPNIVFVMADDLGYGELGCYGQEKIKTPNIDKIAKDGIKLTRYYSACTVCAPTRTSLMTGKHTGHSPIRGNKEVGGWGLNEGEGQMALPSSEVTVAEVLQSKGYATAAFGKWGMGAPASEGRPTNQGFDYFFGYLCQRQAHNYTPTHLWENDDVYILDKNHYFSAHQRFERVPDNFTQFMGPQYAPAVTIEKAEQFIDKVPDNKPFFIYFATTLPHVALQAPKEWVDKYPREWDDKPYIGQNGYLPNERPRATYAAMISYLDDCVRRLMDAVDKNGRTNNTIVIFCADNGTAPNGGVDREFFNSTGGLRGMKTNTYEGGIRIPFVAKWPGKIRPGSTNSDYWSSYDVLPTLASIAQTTSLDGIDGISFQQTLLGQQQQRKHDFLYFEYPEGNQQQAVISGGYKMIFPNLKNNPTKLELYNIEQDPGETKDIAGANEQILDRLLAIAQREHVNNKDFPIPALDNR